ncbi:MAG TPA: MBL fold metallo-hydrolase [Weissella thailandensis]|uniref:MBL fold metallo-hydrolase n=1 Tax=Weissella thailandensis TaxID=89061 RepID=UPI001DF5BA88|nr:MBL fold metallo-hydrolase [Weissella thailandensis]HJG84403.1 MBL fold metallo-hydrolase [Weissella thailandensis]
MTGFINGKTDYGSIDLLPKTSIENVLGIENAKVARSQISQKTDIGKLYFPKILNFQEDCALYNSEGKWILFDTGDENDWDNISQFIASKTSRIDIVVISHYHHDHCGNVENIINSSSIDTSKTIWYLQPVPEDVGLSVNDVDNSSVVLVKDKIVGIINESGGISEIVNRDLTINVTENISISFMNTTKESYDFYHDMNIKDLNEYSLNALLDDKGARMLFTGDSKYWSEKWMYQNYREFDKPIDLLKANHHSYDKDAYEYFFIKLNPKFVVSTLDHKNYYTYAADDSGINSSVLNLTDSMGANITFLWRGEASYQTSNGDIHEEKVYKFIRGTRRPTIIHYYINPNKIATDRDDGSEFAPFQSIDEAVSHVSNRTNIQYSLILSSGNYGDVKINDISVPLYINAKDSDIFFNTLSINNVQSLIIDGDLKFLSAKDRTINIQAANSLLINDSVISLAEGARSSYYDSRFIAIYRSTAKINKVDSNGRSMILGSYDSSNVSVQKIIGYNNLLGIQSSKATTYCDYLVPMTASVMKDEINGKVLTKEYWQFADMSSGFHGSDNNKTALQYKVSDNITWVRGDIVNDNTWIPNKWVTVAKLPKEVIFNSGRQFRFPATTTSTAGVVVMVKPNGEIQINTTSEQTYVIGINLNFKID